MSAGKMWRGLDEPGQVAAEAARTPEFLNLERPGPDRREFLRLMGAGLALAGLSGCGEEHHIVSPVDPPEGWIPGKAMYYATAVVLDGIAQPVIATTHQGRPTKLEGNPHHPASRGVTDAFTQAAVLDVYDPDRSKIPLHRGAAASWAEFETALAGLRAKWAKDGGSRLRILLEPTNSPTLLRQLNALARSFSGARFCMLEPLCGDTTRGTELAFGRALAPRLKLDAAAFVLSFDADVLGAGPLQVLHARAWTSRRRAQGLEIAMAQSTPTLTGARADLRLPVGAGRMPLLLAYVAAKLGLGEARSDIGEGERAWADATVAALSAHRGSSLIAAGPTLPPEAVALAHRLNHALGNVSQTVEFTEPISLPAQQDVAALLADIAAGTVDELFSIACNPAYALAHETGFRAKIARIPTTLHAGTHVDETARRSVWHLPLAHALESWSDARSGDGLVTLMQPTLRPLYAARTIHQILDMLLGTGEPDIAASVHQTWRESFGLADADARRDALVRGFVENSAPPAIDPNPSAGALPALQGSSANELEAVFRPDDGAWDGRFANNAWLQEMPRPLSKLVWGNPVGLAPDLAREFNLENGDMVRVSAGGRSIVGPTWIQAGQAPRTVTLFLGQGREAAGRVGNGVGYDAATLRKADAWRLGGVVLARAAGHIEMVTTQYNQTMAGRDHVRVVDNAAAAVARPETSSASLYESWPQPSPAWAMVIDLDACIGCNACAIACQAENNVPVVGREQVAIGREMHWLRIDRYYAGAEGDPDTYFQPVPCMHCEKAPCELGCPVKATVHGPSGLNEMVYNRCIGTRTCSSFCPYKVRRFNWFDYSDSAPQPIPAQRNPNVSVRLRGVMEKCTYCIQRIADARAAADIQNRPIRDGEVVTACQAACPTQAIVFGDKTDSAAKVTAARKSPRNYVLVADIDTRPRTSYLARVARRRED